MFLLFEARYHFTQSIHTSYLHTQFSHYAILICDSSSPLRFKPPAGVCIDELGDQMIGDSLIRGVHSREVWINTQTFLHWICFYRNHYERIVMDCCVHAFVKLPKVRRQGSPTVRECSGGYACLRAALTESRPRAHSTPMPEGATMPAH